MAEKLKFDNILSINCISFLIYTYKEFVIKTHFERTVLHSLLLLILSFGTLHAIEIHNLSEAINIAGKQRMYTQRMLKDYAMIGMQNSFGNPKEDLAKTIQNFEEHLHALEQFTKDSATKASLQKVKALWEPIKTKLNQTPSKQTAQQLQHDLDALLKEADNATKLFAAQSTKKSGEIINISGRQRMLSQRMASLYMLKVWGINDPAFKKKMDQTMALFKSSLEKLRTYENNTPEITKLLNKVKRSFMFFEIMNRSNSKFIPSLIYRKSNEILKDMNQATSLYVALERN